VCFSPVRRALLLSTFCLACATPARTIHIVAKDYALQSPDSTLAGLTHFQFQNDGKVPHEVAIGRLRPDAGIQEMLAAAQRGLRLRDAPDHYLDGAPFGVLFAWPGGTSPAELTVVLERGQRYALLCTFRDSLAAPEHAALGMMRVLYVH
jgi:hypothetical protein